jgi:rRNA maturation endonuclease Nob1
MKTALIVIGVIMLLGAGAVVVGLVLKSAARLWEKICPSCQARIRGASHKCHFCGTALTRAAATSKTVR